MEDLDWIRYTDAKTGQFYYHNSVTQETQWEAPSSFKIFQEPDEPQDCEENSSSREHALERGASYMYWINKRKAEEAEEAAEPVEEEEEKAPVVVNEHVARLNALLDSAPAAKVEWKKYWDETQQKYYYFNSKTQKTQWEVPEEANWLPSSEETTQDKFMDYTTAAKFNRVTGRFDALGGEEYFAKAGIPTDRAGRQMSAFFNMTEFEKNREEYKRKKLQLQTTKSIDWKKYNAQKKAQKRKRQNQWLFED